VFSRSLSRQLEIRLAYADQISDTYSDQIRGIASSRAPSDTGVVGAGGAPNFGFGGGSAPGAGVVTPNFGSADLYKTKRGEVALANHGEALEYTFAGYARRVNYFTLVENDYEEAGGRLGGNWNKAPRRILGRADYLRRTFTNLDRTDVIINYGLGVDYRLNGNVTVTLTGAVAKQQKHSSGKQFCRPASDGGGGL
jgi:hypothetical protein